MSPWPLIGILSIHTLADFFLQSDWMALGKSKRLSPLIAHTGLYALTYLVLLQLGKRSSDGALLFSTITWILHTLTDFITSRVTSKLWFLDMVPLTTSDWEILRERPLYRRVINFDQTVLLTAPNRLRHWFWCAIGVDQWIHAVTLILTWYYVYGA